MRALALTLALAVSLPALAQPKDAPALASVPVLLTSGQPAPSDGLLLPAPIAIEAAQRLAAAEAKTEVLEAGLSKMAPWWVVAAVGAVALGAGFGVGLALRR